MKEINKISDILTKDSNLKITVEVDGQERSLVLTGDYIFEVSKKIMQDRNNKYWENQEDKVI